MDDVDVVGVVGAHRAVDCRNATDGSDVMELAYKGLEAGFETHSFRTCSSPFFFFLALEPRHGDGAR
jgi:hypothetical protein